MKIIINLIADHEVQGIDWSLLNRDPRMPDKVAVEVKVGDRCKTFYGDYVICTMSIGYLQKNHTTLFHPGLDSKKV